VLYSPRLRHICFPRSAWARRLVDFSPAKVSPPRATGEEPRLAADESAFVDWLFNRARLDATHYRSEMLARRLTACLRVLRATSLKEARCAIEQEPSQLDAAMSAMLIGATAFFRDESTFRYLARDVLPAMTARRSVSYIWSAGCSNGEELFSVAMLLAEQQALRRSYLLGTDCRGEAIAQSKRGWYAPAEMAGVPDELRLKYFANEGAGFRIHCEMAGAARWRVADVLAMREHGLWDMILFRNAAIYMRGPSIAALWEQLEASLRVGGVLVLGRAERPAAATRLEQCGPCVYRKTRR
jgi:chemotaxis protein methyltransferase CheR